MPERASLLQREIRQRKPFRSPRQEGAIGLLRTSDLLRRTLSHVVDPEGITLQQYNVLRILRGAGEAGLPTLEIADRMIERSPGITRLLDRLESKALVRRARCARDRRQVLCFITQAGSELLARLDEPIARAEDDFLRPLAGSNVERLIGILDAVRVEHPDASTHKTTQRSSE
jgi:DNA-binding MarR family transcriptional regulator